MKKRALLFILLILLLSEGALSFCGNFICEEGELQTCKDCALINPNYRCDNFSFLGSLVSYDPDCREGICYDSIYTYGGGRGISCYPGKCVEPVGCVHGCSSSANCSSGLCTPPGICSVQCIVSGPVAEEYAESCCGVYNSSSGECTYPPLPRILFLNSGVVLDEPLKINFVVLPGGWYNVSATAFSCSVEYPKRIVGERMYTLTINNCGFEGIGILKLEVWNSTVKGESKTAFISVKPTLLEQPWDTDFTPLYAIHVNFLGKIFLLEVGI